MAYSAETIVDITVADGEDRLARYAYDRTPEPSGRQAGIFNWASFQINADSGLALPALSLAYQRRFGGSGVLKFAGAQQHTLGFELLEVSQDQVCVSSHPGNVRFEEGPFVNILGAMFEGRFVVPFAAGKISVYLSTAEPCRSRLANPQTTTV